MPENTEFIGLGYDQVLLVPGASNVLPYSVTLRTQLSENFELNIPLVSDAFGPETDTRVATTALNGGLGVVAEQEDLSKQVASLQQVKETVVDTDKYPNALVDSQNHLRVAAEVWLVAGAETRVAALVNAGADAIFFYLHETLAKNTRDLIKQIRQAHPDLFIAVGVVEDQSIAAALYEAGADTILAGRSVESSLPNDITYPFLTVTMNIADVAAAYDNKSVIAVGGIHYSGDIVKAIAAGADATMVSDLLKGSVLESDGSFKEGDMSIDDAIFQTDGGLRAGMGYTGSQTIESLKLNAKIVQITDNGLRESHPHDVEITKQAPNYAKG
ncbi:MAG: IMP dehydrogenase [Leuconostoc mesenteroides]|uniref:IMP dehydrogenase / GMP reductase domain protein n=1 Tax=Leuconostoc mesenteroides subsp. cremoris ATCC 19254 TaxID=586220 RepID=C2KKX5_LEUMC|nr:IMP dehydrogenase [Leuconostoc mesenteroides]EQC84657.1 IMP dehydrogenase [Leuconostoc mesenteroides subsp. cremoris TIFN8]KDA51870.1 Inosine-5'-monophosphate dehydrogenase [Leuconostoc mesenteroides subsp. cremoris T26]EEJ42120.1 IMP dehydrogenase / GMP reductase domain protein [Leuconostoc mesenteroides subsp. cremoris ATCC 19254]MDG9749914.1 IMP dehydrogenase [Leuconostoc mesenteroides]ORI38251.1 IMP dehydrogenase [Leuconostoc mesenteroides subsp. cremoris]